MLEVVIHIFGGSDREEAHSQKLTPTVVGT